MSRARRKSNDGTSRVVGRTLQTLLLVRARGNIVSVNRNVGRAIKTQHTRAVRLECFAFGTAVSRRPPGDSATDVVKTLEISSGARDLYEDRVKTSRPSVFRTARRDQVRACRAKVRPFCILYIRVASAVVHYIVRAIDTEISKKKATTSSRPRRADGLCAFTFRTTQTRAIYVHGGAL